MLPRFLEASNVVPMASIDAGALVDLSAMLESIVCSCLGVRTMRCRSEKGDCAHFSWNGGVGILRVHG